MPVFLRRVELTAIGILACVVNATAVAQVVNTWAAKKPIPSARQIPASSTVAGKIYVIGGASPSGTFPGTVEEFDPATNSWATKASMPTGRFYPSAASVGDKIYVFGGDTLAGRSEADSTLIVGKGESQEAAMRHILRPQIEGKFSYVNQP